MLFSLSRDVVPEFSGLPSAFINEAARFLRIESGRVERVVKACCSVVIYCGLARQELSGQLVDLVFFWLGSD